MNPRTRLSRRQSHSFERQQRDRTIWKTGIFLIAVLAWVFVLSRLSWLGPFTIYNVEVYGADPDITATLRNAALTELQGSYLALFARSNTFIYPNEDISHAVTEASSRIASVDIHRTGVHGLAITVTEKAPAALVCAELPDFSASDTDCYYADPSGRIFEQAPATSTLIWQRYYEPDLSDTASSSGPIGQYATSSQEFSALQAFSEGARENGIPVLGILMKDGGEYELYADNPSGASASSTESHADIAVIYFNDAGGLPTELSDLIAFWSKEVADAKMSHASLHFDSIDVRYGSNVFYRLQK